MAKVQIKSEKLTPFGGFFPIMEPSPHTLSSAHPSRILFLQLNQFPYCFHIQKREREDETRKKHLQRTTIRTTATTARTTV